MKQIQEHENKWLKTTFFYCIESNCNERMYQSGIMKIKKACFVGSGKRKNTKSEQKEILLRCIRSIK